MLSRAALSSKCERKQSCAATDGTVDVGGLVAYLIFVIFLHMQNFWRMKSTLKFTQ